MRAASMLPRSCGLLRYTSPSTPVPLTALFQGQATSLDGFRTTETEVIDLLVDASYEKLSAIPYQLYAESCKSRS